MIKRIIENEIGERLEVVVVSGLVGISAEIGFSTYEFLFDNDEDIHCFISELQRAMIVAKEEKKFAVDTGEDKLVDPIDLKIPNDMFKAALELCICGKPMFTDRCTRLGCDNWNVFGSGTVDTTSNGTDNDK